MPANPQVTDEMVEKAKVAIGDASERAGQTGDLRTLRLTEVVCECLAKAALTAALADHVVVPREPTAEMLKVGAQTYYEENSWQPSRIYRAMISAAPLPQKEG